MNKQSKWIVAAAVALFITGLVIGHYAGSDFKEECRDGKARIFQTSFDSNPENGGVGND
jgi:hypothetical protein